MVFFSGLFAYSGDLETFVGIILHETSRQDPADIRLKLYSLDPNLQAAPGQNGVVFDASTIAQQVNTESE